MAGLLVCLFQHWPTTPTPSSITVASTLVLKPVCSSSGCKSFQALVVPLFLDLSPLSLPFPSLFSCSQLQHLQLPSSCCSPQKWKERGGCGQEQTWSVSSFFVCHLTRSFLHCWFLQLLLCGNGAPTGRYCTLPEQTFSSLPLKCPFCMSSWKNGAFCCPTTLFNGMSVLTPFKDCLTFVRHVWTYLSGVFFRWLLLPLLFTI